MNSFSILRRRGGRLFRTLCTLPTFLRMSKWQQIKLVIKYSTRRKTFFQHNKWRHASGIGVQDCNKLYMSLQCLVEKCGMRLLAFFVSFYFVSYKTVKLGTFNKASLLLLKQFYITLPGDFFPLDHNV